MLDIFFEIISRVELPVNLIGEWIPFFRIEKIEDFLHFMYILPNVGQ